MLSLAESRNPGNENPDRPPRPHIEFDGAATSIRNNHLAALVARISVETGVPIGVVRAHAAANIYGGRNDAWR